MGWQKNYPPWQTGTSLEVDDSLSFFLLKLGEEPILFCSETTLLKLKLDDPFIRRREAEVHRTWKISGSRKKKPTVCNHHHQKNSIDQWIASPGIFVRRLLYTGPKTYEKLMVLFPRHMAYNVNKNPKWMRETWVPMVAIYNKTVGLLPGAARMSASTGASVLCGAPEVEVERSIFHREKWGKGTRSDGTIKQPLYIHLKKSGYLSANKVSPYHISPFKGLLG